MKTIKARITTKLAILMAAVAPLTVAASANAQVQTRPPGRQIKVVNKYVVRNVYRSGGANTQRSLPGQGYYGYRSGYGTPSFGGERTDANYPQYHRSGYYDAGYLNHRYPQVRTRTPGGYQPSSDYESNMPPQSQPRSYPTYQRQSSSAPYTGQAYGGYGDNNGGDGSQVQGTQDEDSQDTAATTPAASSSHKKKHQSLIKRLEHGVEREIHPALRDLRHDAERQLHPVLRQARTDAEAWAASQLGL